MSRAASNRRWGGWFLTPTCINISLKTRANILFSQLGSYAMVVPYTPPFPASPYFTQFLSPSSIIFISASGFMAVPYIPLPASPYFAKFLSPSSIIFILASGFMAVPYIPLPASPHFTLIFIPKFDHLHLGIRFHGYSLYPTP